MADQIELFAVRSKDGKFLRSKGYDKWSFRKRPSKNKSIKT